MSTAAAGPGRLVRGGRSLARFLLVWLAATAALWLLDDALPGFGAEALHRVLRGWLTDLGHPEPVVPAQA